MENFESNMTKGEKFLNLKEDKIKRSLNDETTKVRLSVMFRLSIK